MIPCFLCILPYFTPAYPPSAPHFGHSLPLNGGQRPKISLYKDTRKCKVRQSHTPYFASRKSGYKIFTFTESTEKWGRRNLVQHYFVSRKSGYKNFTFTKSTEKWGDKKENYLLSNLYRNLKSNIVKVQIAVQIAIGMAINTINMSIVVASVISRSSTLVSRQVNFAAVAPAFRPGI